MRRIAILCLVLGAWEPFTTEQKDVKEGNERYGRGDYSGAGESYSRAVPQLPAEPAVRFDLGAAMYQVWRQAPDSPTKPQLLEAARQNWSAVGDNPQTDARLRSRAHYNLGNAALDEGKSDDAIKLYQRALVEDPRNDDARHNLELARQKKQPPPPQGGGKQKNPDPKDQKQQQPQQQNQQGQPNDPSQQQQQQPNQDQPDQQRQQPQDDPNKDQQPDQQKEQQQPAPQPQNNQDDSDRKLRALERRSRDLQVDKQRAAERRLRRKAEDW
ncbi:MAG TPA: tetratricopeptide repeat protein [Haliangiales bacterium]|nr:tetratricopeptide repeat protein [Haliangiales bacterium]